MDRLRLFLYGILPAFVSIGLVAAYFSQVEWLHNLIAPVPNREEGLVENVQNLTLLAMAVLCAVSARRERSLRARLAWTAIALLACLVLLEEVDYGMHWYRAWNDIPYDYRTNVNLHNSGRRTKYIMILVDTVTVAAFAVAPFLVRYVPPRLRPFVPSAYSVLTLLVIVATGNLARALLRNGWQHNGSLTNNFSEFREVLTYWLAFLYLREVSLRRKTAPAPDA